jgi:hypothetical protein
MAKKQKILHYDFDKDSLNVWNIQFELWGHSVFGSNSLDVINKELDSLSKYDVAVVSYCSNIDFHRGGGHSDLIKRLVSMNIPVIVTYCCDQYKSGGIGVQFFERGPSSVTNLQKMIDTV